MGAGIALVLSMLPAAASAYDETWLGSTMVKVTGSPLEFGVGENASLHANLDGSGDSDIFWFDEAGPTFAVAENGGVRTYGTVSVEGDELKVVSLPVVSGDGTGADPWTVTSTWDAGSPARLRVTEVVRYTEGSQRFHVAFTAQNVSGAPVSFRPYLSTEVAADFSVPLARSGAVGPGSVGLAVPLDGGTRDPNDPVFDGYAFGRATDLEPDSLTPWQRAVSGDGQAARLAISQGQALPSTLPTRARWQPLLAADWGQRSLAPGATYTFGAWLRHASALRTIPLITGTPNTQPYTLQVRTDLADGGPLAGRRLGWIVDGYSRELSGTMTTDANGHASLTWTADGQQHDRVIVWVDTDGDGRWDRDVETTRQSQVDWEGDWPNDTPGSGVTGSDVTATGGGVTGVAVGAGAPPLPAGTAPVPAGSTRARLRIAGVTLSGTRGGIRVRGRTSRAVPRVSIRIATTRGRLLGKATARVKAKRFATLVRTRKRVRRVVVTVSYAGDAKTAPLRKRVVTRVL